MPYENQFASKSSHKDIVENPEVAAFLDSCEYLVPPTEDEGARLAQLFVEPPRVDDPTFPEDVVAIDGSYFEAARDDRLPSTRVGYVKVGGVVVSLSAFGGLRVEGGKYVDPFKMAALEEANWPLTFPLPSSNVRLRGKQSVRDSFRAIVDSHLFDARTRFEQHNPSTSLRDTLFELFSLRPDVTATPGEIKLPRCPSCKKPEVRIQNSPVEQTCDGCGEAVFAADCLRLWEEVGEYQSNQTAMSRFMNILEHLLSIHYIRYLADRAPSRLAHIAFFVDGPLAVFGTAAWLHAAILRFINQVNDRLRSQGHPPILMIGLQKTGQVVEYFRLVDRYIPKDRLLCLDDEFRYRYVITGREPSQNGFGSETYYGQDFLYKTQTGRMFVFGMPYPFARKASVPDFPTAKTQLANYDRLADAIALIDHFETDLYENAVIPIALAHRYTAISLVPGGTVLNLLTADGLPT